MNLQLIESLMQVILALPPEEQAALSERLAQAQLSNCLNLPDSVDIRVQILQPLVVEGRIIPPMTQADLPPFSEVEFKRMVSALPILGQPLSETVIEERGKW
jgi:hypothetical protein